MEFGVETCRSNESHTFSYQVAFKGETSPWWFSLKKNNKKPNKKQKTNSCRPSSFKVVTEIHTTLQVDTTTCSEVYSDRIISYDDYGLLEYLLFLFTLNLVAITMRMMVTGLWLSWSTMDWVWTWATLVATCTSTWHCPQARSWLVTSLQWLA